ncbi:ESX-1 secretion-associated protein [Mycobacterium ahvazicum]|uniref:ESX-1 secretion-associated protein n=1 Tax=Mycobacterium ahvazicum TaxID=1964395 RepID=A0A2K4Y8V2_9MYCO|nr:type VII secretion target [Mycobacterium ahvazicum]SOX53211.1 ESX-1 secretion-associated protein [Mycobacterium ahvazicum]
MDKKLDATPQHIVALATAQESAAAQALRAGATGSNLRDAVWVTHGVISGASNVAFTKASAARAKTAEAVSKTAAALAQKLQTAKNAYQNTDEAMSNSLAAQFAEYRYR